MIILPANDLHAVFVFGSNQGGYHGAGAALYAVEHYGAIPRQAFGLQGRSFAIPTKSRTFTTLPLMVIEAYVKTFLAQAKNDYPDKVFYLTPIGCGLAGLTPAEVAPMFKDAPANVILPPEFIIPDAPEWARRAEASAE